MFGKRHLLPDQHALLAEEVISAFQKDVRRGHAQAWYWADALLREGYWKAAFNRIMIIASEDVGLGSPFLPVALWKEYVRGKKHLRGKKWTDSKGILGCRETLHAAVQLLVSAPKSRALNNLVIMARMDIAQKISLDIPTPRQIFHPQDGHANDLLNALSAQLEEKNPRKALVCVLGLHLYGEMTKKTAEMYTFIWILLEFHAEQAHSDAVKETVEALSEFYKVKPNTLFVAHAICLLSGKLTDKVTISVNQGIPEPVMEEKIPEFDWSTPRAIPDYALDKHTYRGRVMDRKIGHFKDVGSQVTNEAFADPHEEAAFAWYAEIEQKAQGKEKTSEFKGAKSTKIMEALMRRKWLPGIGSVDVEIQSRTKGKKGVKKDLPPQGTKRKKSDTQEHASSAPPLHTQKNEKKSETQAHGSSHSSSSSSSSAPKRRKKNSDPEAHTWEPMPLPVFNITAVSEFPLRLDFSTPFVMYESKLEILGKLTDLMDAQLPCGWKPRTLLAKYGDFGVFVKGPLSEHAAKAQAVTEATKIQVAGVRGVGCVIWKDPTGYYVLMPDLIGGDSATYPFTVKSCKRYPNLRVLDSSTLSFKIVTDWLEKRKLTDLPHRAQEEFLAVLLFRRWLGISDTNFRNMAIKEIQLPSNNILYSVHSVDETRIGWDPTPRNLFSQRMKFEHQKIVLKWLYEDHAPYVSALLAHWERSGLYLERLSRVKKHFLAKELV